MAAERLEARQMSAGDMELVKELKVLLELSGSQPEHFVHVANVAFFVADDGWNGRSLWTTDGTEAGTVRVKDIVAGPASSRPMELTNLNGTLFFYAADDPLGLSLWKSDGTEAGTLRVKEGGTGSYIESPRSLENVYGTLYFTAQTEPGRHGLWRSDGTDAGVASITLSDGLAPSLGRRPVAAGDRLFLAGSRPDVGEELFSLNLLTPSDYDRSGGVDGADLLQWQREFGGTPAAVGAGADGDRSGVLDAGDLALWQLHHGSGTPSAPGVGQAASNATSADPQRLRA